MPIILYYHSELFYYKKQKQNNIEILTEFIQVLYTNDLNTVKKCLFFLLFLKCNFYVY